VLPFAAAPAPSCFIPAASVPRRVSTPLSGPAERDVEENPGQRLYPRHRWIACGEAKAGAVARSPCRASFMTRAVNSLSRS
jgi:hypothetical protein